jgi:prophage antirepressor-like protein
VAKDVAAALGYPASTIVTSTSKLLQHVPEEWKGKKPILTPGGTQEMWCLSEQGLCFFLNRSDKPGALPLQKWVAGKVLPRIRKTGGYVAGKEHIESEEELTLRVLQMLHRKVEAQKVVIAEQDQKLEIAREIYKEQKPKVDVYDPFMGSNKSYTMAEAAKPLSDDLGT